MDNRLVIAVLFVTLSWMSVGTYANNMTTTGPNNMTSPMHNATMTPTHNATMTPTHNATMAPTHNATMPPTHNATMTPMHNATMTPMHNATMTPTHNATMNPTHNLTSTTSNTAVTPGNTTMTPGNTTMNPTTESSTTTAAPLTPNITVTNLETPVSRAECMSQQLCASQPSDCDPSTAGSCFFFAAKVLSGNNFELALSGESEGYLATTLSPDTNVGNGDPTYVCANNNGVVQFFSTLLTNGRLETTELNVNSVKGNINGSKIQCTFAATVPNPQTRASGFSISIANGTFNSSSNELGSPVAQFRSPLVNLRDPNATVTNEISNNTTTTTTTTTTTVSPTTTGHAVTLQQSLMHALLISVGVLGLAIL